MALPVQVALFQGGLAAPFVENLEILRGRAQEAKEKGAHLIIAPEVFFTGTGS
jgi:predicted amidohydrolase